jgi:hypothetical protein
VVSLTARFALAGWPLAGEGNTQKEALLLNELQVAGKTQNRGHAHALLLLLLLLVVLVVLLLLLLLLLLPLPPPPPPPRNQSLTFPAFPTHSTPLSRPSLRHGDVTAAGPPDLRRLPEERPFNGPGVRRGRGRGRGRGWRQGRGRGQRSRAGAVAAGGAAAGAAAAAAAGLCLRAFAGTQGGR